MILHQALAIEEMIASCVGNCKCFNKLDQSRIDLRRGCEPWSTTMNFSRPCALHPGKMLRVGKRKQDAYAPIVELDMIGNKTDKFSEDENGAVSLILRAPPSGTRCAISCMSLQPECHERREMFGLVDFPAFLLDFDRVRCVPFLPFLARN
ncbi:hypothetical protein [Bradyrhizobium sp. 25ACV]